MSRGHAPNRRRLIPARPQPASDPDRPAPLSAAPGQAAQPLAGALALIAEAKRLLAQLFAQMTEPDQELPMFLLLAGAGQAQGFLLPPPALEERQEILLQRLPELVTQHQAEAVVLGASAWMAPDDPRPPHEHPQRREKVIVYVLLANGQEALVGADLARSSGPPRLGAFEVLAQGSLPGLVPKALRGALDQVVRGAPDAGTA